MVRRTILLVSIFQISYALDVTHLVKPNSTFESISLNNSCSTIKGDVFSVKCNPALFNFSKAEGISILALGKADGDSIDNGRSLIFDPIDEKLIRKLFEESNYNSFTFNSSINFNTSYFELSYSPYYLLADIYVFNPAFPEVSLNLLNRESIRITSGQELGFISNSIFKVYTGMSLFYFKDAKANNVFSLFDLTNNEPGKLIVFNEESGIDGDIGLFLDFESLYIPNLSLQVKNITTNLSSSSDSFRMGTIFLNERYTVLGIGKSFSTAYGALELNIDTNFKGISEAYEISNSSLGLRYNISLFSLMFGISQYYQSFGMNFKSQNFNLGVAYILENDVPRVQKRQTDSTYISLEFVL